MRTEILLRIILIIVSIAGYILYCTLNNKITELKTSLHCSDMFSILYQKRVNEMAVKCAKLENEVNKLKSENSKIKGC